MNTTKIAGDIDFVSLAEYLKEFITLQEGIDLKKDVIKNLIEGVSDSTGLEKVQVSKYFKARYDAKTGDTKEIGELFAALDDGLEN